MKQNKSVVVSYMTKELSDNSVETNSEKFGCLVDAVVFAQKLSRKRIIGTKAIIGRPTVS